MLALKVNRQQMVQSWGGIFPTEKARQAKGGT